MPTIGFHCSHEQIAPGRGVTAPGQRYHPAVTALAIATMSRMYPGGSR